MTPVKTFISCLSHKDNSGIGEKETSTESPVCLASTDVQDYIQFTSLLSCFFFNKYEFSKFLNWRAN